MISVPQLLGAVLGVGAVFGAVSTLLVFRLSNTKPRLRVREVKPGSKHFVPVATPTIKALSQVVRWYGPNFSPKDVPAFYDVSSFTENPKWFQYVIDLYVSRYESFGANRPTVIIGYDARGFLLGPPIALAMKIPFVLLRKDLKCPGVVIESTPYEKEYKEAHGEKQCLRLGSVKAGDRVVLIDDLIATGGTAISGIQLVEGLGAKVVEFSAIIELDGLNGVQKIREADGGKYKDLTVFTLLSNDTIDAVPGSDPKNWKEGGRLIPIENASKIMRQYSLN